MQPQFSHDHHVTDEHLIGQDLALAIGTIDKDGTLYVTSPFGYNTQRRRQTDRQTDRAIRIGRL